MAEIEDALRKGHGGDATVRCRGHSINEIWYNFNVAGTLQTGKFVPSNPGWLTISIIPLFIVNYERTMTKRLIDGMKSNCPARGIRYQPKRHHPSHPTKTFTTTGTAKPTATGIPFQGLGNLKVSTLGQGRGCIISHGTWFTSGTCATFRGERIRGLSFLLTQKVSQINPRLLTISPLYR